MSLSTSIPVHQCKAHGHVPKTQKEWHSLDEPVAAGDALAASAAHVETMSEMQEERPLCASALRVM